jgi:hypothetical protein
MTCRRRLRDWHEAGVWQRLHELLLAELHAAGALDWSKAVIDSSHVRALKGKVTFDAHILETGTQSYRLRTSKTASRSRKLS